MRTIGKLEFVHKLDGSMVYGKCHSGDFPSTLIPLSERFLYMGNIYLEV